MRDDDPDGVLDAVLAFNAGRDPALLARKLAAMARAPFVFFRGTAHLFYAGWRPDAPLGATTLGAAPATWAVGDLHLENFGSYRGDNRLTYFDVNDFDEAALAPATADLTRLLTSVLLGGAAEGLDASERRQACAHLLAAYRAALRDGTARWVERRVARGPARTLLRRVRRRSREDLLDERTSWRRGERHLAPDPRHPVPVTAAERGAIAAALGAHVARVTDGGLRRRETAYLRVIDVVRRVAGTGSLGIPRFVVLVEGRGGPRRNALIDLKAARPSVLAPAVAVETPERWATEADRVVAVQRRMQAVPPARLAAVEVAGVPFVLRELQPSEDRLSLAQVRGPRRVARFMETLGQVVAWGQLRSSGRGASATADALGDWAASLDGAMVAALIEDARAREAMTERQWRAFAAAAESRSGTTA